MITHSFNQHKPKVSVIKKTEAIIHQVFHLPGHIGQIILLLILALLAQSTT
jgi:hypothetical protein